MRARQIIRTASLAMALGAGLLLVGPASAQQAPGANPQRDCQTVRTCNFARNGQVRGCLSSYTCRTCRLVTSRCTIGAKSGNCRELVCSWGG